MQGLVRIIEEGRLRPSHARVIEVDGKQWYSTEKVKEVIGISDRTVHNWRDNQLQGFQDKNGRWYYTRESVERNFPGNQDLNQIPINSPEIWEVYRQTKEDI